MTWTDCQPVSHLVSQLCVYILYVLLLCSCSVSDWQPGAKPGKSLGETQDVSRWPCTALVFLSTSLAFPNVIRKAAQVLFLACAFIFEWRGRVCTYFARWRLVPLSDYYVPLREMRDVEFNQVFTNATRRHWWRGREGWLRTLAHCRRGDRHDWQMRLKNA